MISTPPHEGYCGFCERLQPDIRRYDVMNSAPVCRECEPCVLEAERLLEGAVMHGIFSHPGWEMIEENPE